MRLFLSFTASLLALSSAAQAVTPIRAADAIDSIGVNTHLNYLDTSYANVQQVVAALKYIGVNQVRDASPSPWNPGSGPLSYYTYAMQQGIHFDFIAHCCQAGFGTDVGQSVDLLKQVPGGITAIEGFNEVDLSPITWMGQTGPAAAVAAQKDLYASFKGNPALKALPVYDVTGTQQYLPDSLAGRADYANAHLYPQNGNQPNGWFKEMAGYATTKKEPLVITEFGYASNPESGWLVIGVGEAAQAKAIANGVMSGIEQGIKRTYLYELLDQKPDPQNKDREWHFGLFTTAYQPKPAAVMLSRMTAMMADTGAQSRTFVPRALSFGLPDRTSSTHFVLMQKSTSASRFLWLWNEAPIWDRAAGQPINSPPVPVTVTLPTGITAYSYSDPAIQTAPVTIYKAKAATVVIQVPDHPVMIELRSQ